MNILQKIKNGKNNKKVLDFPGTDTKVALVILTSAELTDAKLSADAYTKELGIEDESYIDIAQQQEIIYRSLRDVNNTENRIADSVADIRELQVNEISFLMVQYNLFQQETSPFLSAVTEEQFDILKKTFETMNLRDLNGESLVALRNFLLSLV